MTGTGPVLLASGVATGWAVGRAVAATRRSALATRLHRDSPAPAVPAWFLAAWRATDLAVSPTTAWRGARVAAVAALVAVVATTPLVAPVLAGVAVLGALVAPSVARRREAGAFVADLPLLVEVLVGALASGASLVQALDGAAARSGPAGSDLRRVLARHRKGTALQASLDRWADERPLVGVRLLVDALALAGSSGGSRARALVAVGDTLRSHDSLQREVRALGAQARASAAVLVVTPVGFAAAAAVADRRVGAVLLGRPIGWACLIGGLALDGAGAWWMARLVGSVR